VLGQLAIGQLRNASRERAIQDLAQQVDPALFERTFGAGLAQLPALVEGRTVTIAKLMEIAPAGTADPTAGLYNTTMYLMACLLFLALISNALMGPVSEKHYMREE
jgi:hypothetical protein